MSAELFVRTEIPPISWEEFKEHYPSGSIALDGFVGKAPKFEANGPYLNANLRFLLMIVTKTYVPLGTY